MSGFLNQAKEAMSGMMGGNSNNNNNANANNNSSGPNASTQGSSGTGSGGMSQDKYENSIQQGESMYKKEFGSNANAMKLEQGFESADKYRLGGAQGGGVQQQPGMGGSGMGRSADGQMGGQTGSTQGAVSGTTSAQDNVDAPTVPDSASTSGVSGTGGMSGDDSAN